MVFPRFRMALSAIVLAWPAAALSAPLTLDQALTLAVQRSAALRSARAGARSAAEVARSAAQLPDPTLQAGLDNLPVSGAGAFDTTRDSMTMKRLGVSQEWLSSAKRAARQAAADAITARDEAQVAAATSDTRLQTALAYLDAFHAERALALSTRMAHHAHEEFEVAQARLSSALGDPQEALASASAQGLAEDDADEARQQQDEALVALRRWIGPGAVELGVPSLPDLPDEDAYVAGHPVVAVLRHDLDVARQAAALAASERTPNWTWQVAYGQRSGYPDMVSVGVSIPLQVAPAQRQDRATASMAARADQAQAGLEEARRAAAQDYQALASRIQALQQRLARYRSAVLVPARQRIESATAGYASNQVGWTTLAEARRAQLDAERKLLALQRDLARAQAQLVFKPLMNGSGE